MDILKDKQLQEELDQNGYAVLNLLDILQVDEFQSEYRSFREQLLFTDGLHITMEQADNTVAKFISDRLIEKAKMCFSPTFMDYKLFQGSFIMKEKMSAKNDIFPHQDWTFVDEKNGFSSYTLWVALCDITKDMGTIGVVPKSHKDMDNIRYSPNEKYIFHTSISDYVQKKNVEYIELKAGQAVLWNHRLVHLSGVNFSEKERLNITFAITSEVAQLKLFWLSPITNKVTEFNVPDDFYSLNNSRSLYDDYQAGKHPKGAVEM